MTANSGHDSHADYEALAARAEAGDLHLVAGSVLCGGAAAEDGRAALRAALERATTENAEPLTPEEEARYAAWSELIEEEFRDD